MCFIGFREHKDDERSSIWCFMVNILEIKEVMKHCIAEGGEDTPEDEVDGLEIRLEAVQEC